MHWHSFGTKQVFFAVPLHLMLWHICQFLFEYKANGHDSSRFKIINRVYGHKLNQLRFISHLSISSSEWSSLYGTCYGRLKYWNLCPRMSYANKKLRNLRSSCVAKSGALWAQQQIQSYSGSSWQRWGQSHCAVFCIKAKTKV